jgi:hypothetical protein
MVDSAVLMTGLGVLSGVVGYLWKELKAVTEQHTKCGIDLAELRTELRHLREQLDGLDGRKRN